MWYDYSKTGAKSKPCSIETLSLRQGVSCGMAEASGSGGVQRLWAWLCGNAVRLTSILSRGQFLGRLFDRVNQIKPVSNVCP